MILTKEQYEALPEHLQKHIRPVTDWVGFKTALKPAAEPIVMARKPAHEPIVMARKPFKGSTIDNVLKNGLGAMNIDATRVPWADAAEQDEAANSKAWGNGRTDDSASDGSPTFCGEYKKKKKSDRPQAGTRTKTFGNDIGSSGVSGGEKEEGWECDNGGRYPSNVIGEVSEGYQNTNIQKYFYNPQYSSDETIPEVQEGYSKFKYCPKVSRKERHVGFADIPKFDKPEGEANGSNGVQVLRKRDPQEFLGNNHPTVKPVALMDYLIKLVTPPSTPELQRKVLDPFMGSGSTGMAATALGHHFTGCELDPKYVVIAETRIDAWLAKDEPEDDEPQLPSELFGT